MRLAPRLPFLRGVETGHHHRRRDGVRPYKMYLACIFSRGPLKDACPMHLSSCDMPAPLSPATVAIIKATVPALEAHGLTITKRMYERLFQNAEIRDLFNQSHHGETGSQPKALAQAVLAYARNIDNLSALAPAVERIAQKHVGLNILPEHYPHVAEALLGAIKDVLGDAATHEILAAWGEAYWFLAHVLIGRETAIYTSLA